MRGTSHQASSLLVASIAAFEFRPTLQVGAAFAVGLVAAAKGPDQLEFRQTLNGLRRILRPFKPRQVRNQPGVFTKPSWTRRGWDRVVLPHGPSEAFIERLFIPHRRVTHWLVTGLVFAGLAWLLTAMIAETREVARYVAAGVLFGWWLHPVLDAVNEAPVQFVPGVWTHLLPKPLRFRSCGAVDTLLCGVMLIAAMYFALRLAPPDWQAQAREATSR